MTSFEDRERAAEAKFALDSETQFRVTARRNKLAGLWAAGLMGKTGDAAETYARKVIRADFEEAGDDDVVRKLAGDLGGKATEAEIRARLVELEAEARRQILAG
ncbi:MAG: DUF1476 domain-containing protein [Alphaproteobacteria bacterium]|nr:DUF1476 domain-containing protein [Alphaproteobacteria bacterium]